MVRRVLSSHSRSRLIPNFSSRKDCARVRGTSALTFGSLSMRRSSTESVTGPLMSRLGMGYFPSPRACAGSSRQMRSKIFCC
jgi:hypothetical protein